MARKRRHHHNPARRHRGHHRNPARHMRRRRFYHNPMSLGGWKNDLALGASMVIAYAAAKKGAELLKGVIPASVPKAELVAEAVAGVAVIVGARMALRNMPNAKSGATAGASGALIVAALSAFAPQAAAMLDLQKVVVVAAPPPAALTANLSAQLSAGGVDAESHAQEY